MALTYTIGTTAAKASGAAQLVGLDVQGLIKAGTIPLGSDVTFNWLPSSQVGVYTGSDCLFGFKGINATCNVLGGGSVLLDCAPIAPRTSSQLFPNTTVFNATWQSKAAWEWWDGDLRINSGFHFSNVKVGTSYGNYAAIRKLTSSSNNSGVSYGSLYLDGVEISNCDNGILCTGENRHGDVVVIKNCNFHDNGAGDGQSHNIYLGEWDLLVFLNSTTNNAHVGHNLKSLARVNIIGWSNLRDTTVPAKAASFCLDMNGGIYLVYHCSIGQELNDMNASLMTNYSTARIGYGPHELFMLGNDWYSGAHYRGNYIKAANPYLDPTQDYHTASQLGWNDFKYCIDGNDFQYFDFPDLDYGATANNAMILPVNSGATDIGGTNRRISSVAPSATTPYSNVNSGKLAQSAVGSYVAGLGYADFSQTVIDNLRDLSIALQAGLPPPTPTQPPAPPDDPVVDPVPTPNPDPVPPPPSPPLPSTTPTDAEIITMLKDQLAQLKTDLDTVIATSEADAVAAAAAQAAALAAVTDLQAKIKAAIAALS